MGTGRTWGLYRLSVWIMNFVYLNILWIVFTLLGGIIFGFAPATISLFTIVRKWIQGYSDIPIFHYFWRNYKKEFFKSNVLGILLSLIGYILYIDFQLLLKTTNTTLQQFTYLPLLLIILVFLLTLLYIFPVYVHYDVKNISVLKHAFMFMILHPFNTILMVVSTIVVYGIMRFIPGLIPFFTASIWAYVLMWCSLLVFKKMEQKQQNLKTTST